MKKLLILIVVLAWVWGMTGCQKAIDASAVYGFPEPTVQITGLFHSQGIESNFTIGSEEYDPDDFDANYSDDVLNDYEKKNAEFLRSVEYSMNPNGYELDR